MFLPWGTDAPIYHRPFATLAVAITCVVSFFAFPAADHEEWMLALGDGIHPLQWLTNLFMHEGLGHLVGNIIFLWAFGLIVEGKIGAIGFLGVYLGMGVLESAVVQALFLRVEPTFMLGASGAIFGLMSLCLVWAPRNELSCIVFLRFVPFDMDISILWFVAFYIAMELIWIPFRGFRPSSELAHLMGAGLGFGLGVLMVKLKLVDCEGWDLFSVLRARPTLDKRISRKTRRAIERPSESSTGKKKGKGGGRDPFVVSAADVSAERTRLFREHLDLGEIEAALRIYQQGKAKGWAPSESDARELIKGMLERSQWNEAVDLMRDYLARTGLAYPRVHIKLAEVLIRRLRRPLQGLRVLDRLADATLAPPLLAAKQALRQEAALLQDDDDTTLELEDELW